MMPTSDANDALPLNTYFAVQLFPGELDSTAIEPVFRVSAEHRKFFRRLEILDTFSMGSNTFLRCRVDQPEMAAVLNEVLQTGRGVLFRLGVSYIAMLPGGRTGTVDPMKMHSAFQGGHRRLYKGTKIKGWERQFAA